MPTVESTCPAILGNRNGCTDAYCASCKTGNANWPCNVDPPCCTCMGGDIPLPPTTTKPPSNEVCGSCSGCLWGSSGLCYTNDIDESYCNAWSDNTWCGAGAQRLYQVFPGGDGKNGTGLPGALGGLQQKFGAIGPKNFEETGGVSAIEGGGVGKPGLTPQQSAKLNPIEFAETGWYYLAEWINDVHSLQPAGEIGQHRWSIEPPGIQIAGVPLHYAPALNAIGAMDPGFYPFGTEVQAARIGNGWMAVLDKEAPCNNVCPEMDGKYCFAAILSELTLPDSDSSNPDAEVTCSARESYVASKCSACAGCKPCDVVNPSLYKTLSIITPGGQDELEAMPRLNEVPQQQAPIEPAAAVASESTGAAVAMGSPGRFGFASLALAAAIGAFAGALGQRAVTSAARAKGARIPLDAPQVAAEDEEATTASDAVSA